jgi:hypothetical protein
MSSCQRPFGRRESIRWLNGQGTKSPGCPGEFERIHCFMMLGIVAETPALKDNDGYAVRLMNDEVCRPD